MRLCCLGAQHRRRKRVCRALSEKCPTFCETGGHRNFPLHRQHPHRLRAKQPQDSEVPVRGNGIPHHHDQKPVQARQRPLAGAHIGIADAPRTDAAARNPRAGPAQGTPAGRGSATDQGGQDQVLRRRRIHQAVTVNGGASEVAQRNRRAAPNASDGACSHERRNRRSPRRSQGSSHQRPDGIETDLRPQPHLRRL